MTVPWDFIFLPSTSYCFEAAWSFARPISCQHVLSPRCGRVHSINKHHSSPSTTTTVSWPTEHKAIVIATLKARTQTKNIISIYGQPDFKLLSNSMCSQGKMTDGWMRPRSSIYTNVYILNLWGNQCKIFSTLQTSATAPKIKLSSLSVMKWWIFFRHMSKSIF